MGDFSRHSADEEGEEDEEGGGPMLGFLFGNVDDSGDLDEEYLDQDAKEHLFALAGQLKESLVNIKESGALSDVGEEQEDYGRKADNAVDYEDIQEEYEGPEVQMQSQDEEAILQDQSFYAQAALAGSSLPLGEDENYDEDEDYDKEDGHAKKEESCKEEFYHEEDEHPQEDAIQELVEGPMMLPWATEDSTGGIADQNTFSVKFSADLVTHATMEEEDAHKISCKLDLPVLYEEDGKEVLRFSELFGQHELPRLCRKDKRHQKHLLPKGKPLAGHTESLEEDGLVLLKFGCTMKTTFDEALDDPADSEGVEGGEDIEDSKDFMQLRQKRYAFESAQPMKEDQGDWHTILERIKPLPSANLQLIHQEDWEEAIVWDEGYSQKVREDRLDNANDNSGSIQEMDVDTREEDAFCMRERDECWQASLEKSNSEVIKSNMMWQVSRPVVLEPLCHKACPRSTPTTRHPQLLRLESLSVSKEVDDVTGVTSQEDIVAKVAGNFQRMNLQCTELLSGSWLDHIIWDDENLLSAKGQNSKVIFNLRDDQMVFEIPEGKNRHHLRAHAAAMLVTPRLRNNGTEGGDAHHLGFSSLARFNISNDKYYMNKKNPQQQKSSLKKRTVHGIKVMHSTPATKLQTMKPKLTNKDLANFHRPKAVWYPHHNEVAAKEQGKLSVAGPMKVILKTMGGKGSKLNVDASESLESVKVKSTKKFGDLRTSEKTKIFYCGKELEDDINLAQQEVKPNSVLHLVRTKVYPWPKAQRLPGETKPTRPPGAFKRKSDLSVKDGHAFVAEYCEERPLLLNNVGMGARLCTYYRKASPTDSTAATLRNDRGSVVGIPVPLEPMEDSPFLGDIRPGDTQTCLETNMFRAPAFHHKVPPTDFLLVRSAKGKLSLRRIDGSYVIGQQEPHMEVLTPGSKTVQSYLHSRLLTYMYREFRSNDKPGSVTSLRADEVMAQFPSLSEGFLRKRLRHCADLQRASGGEMMWIMKKNFRIPSEEELRRMVTPENVCAYESMQAGLYHLKRMGVSKLTQPSGLSVAMNQLPDEALVLAAASHLERELQITPWNLSCNFVAATMQGRGSLERLEITGAGDPSGRGLGFSYLRAAPKPPGSSALVEKKAAAARGGGAVTGTDADLRRLSMDAAREVLLKFNVPESQIEKLTRWHRIALVRKLSSEQAASGVKLGASALNKFARGQRMSFLQLQQQTREKCQEIWDRQVQSLSAADGENSESEGEANEDLDSFAGDLENLLEAEGETEEVASAKTKKEAIRGAGARRRALEAQREEDIEDEEAEAAELRRMLMEDDELEDVKKKKKNVNSEKDPEDPVKEQNKDAQDATKLNGSRKKKIIKRIIRTKKPDGTYTSKEILITDPKEVAQYLARKNAAQNGSFTKEKKAPFLSRKVKQTGFVKDGKKPKKATKGEGGRDGVQLVCGACKQLGHMRTNKKVCPMYSEEGKTNIHKIENIDTSEPSVRQGIKITLKSATGPVQDKEQPLLSADNSVPPKIPCLKIKLPFAGNVDVAVASTSKVNESCGTPPVQEGHIGVFTADASKLTEGVANLVKKIKVQKRPKSEYDNYQDQNKGIRVRGSHVVNHIVSPVELEKQETPRREYARNQREYELEAEAVKEVLVRRQKEERPFHMESEEDRLEKERIKEMRRRREKKRMKEEKEKAKAREKEEKQRRREEEERERLRIEKQRELEEQAEAHRREERHKEMVRMERQRQEMERKEIERQQQVARERAEREKQKGRKDKGILQGKRALTRDRSSLGIIRSISEKRRSSVEGDVFHSVPEYSHQPKRRKGGEVLLANILENVVDNLRKSGEPAFWFQKPVTKKVAPDYLDVIKTPMDLSTIRERARKMMYKSRCQFRNDVWQIRENAYIYNEIRNPGIPPLADRLLALCDELLEDKAIELSEAESTIERIEEDLYAAPSRIANRRTSQPY